MNIKHLDALTKCSLFKGMSAAEVSLLLKCFRPRVRRLHKNEVVNAEGDCFEGIGVVLEGQVMVVKESAAGNRMILSVLRPGDLFGEMAAFSGGGKWPATITAQTACTVMYVSPEKITGQCEQACQGHRILTVNMFGILSSKALDLSRRLEFLSVKSIRGRIVSFLLEQYKNSGRNTFMLAMNRNELADYLNVTRPSLSREMCRMRDEGLLDFHRSSIQLKNTEALKNEVQ